MKKGLLIYYQEDYKKNKAYAEWLIDTASRHHLSLLLVLAEAFLSHGLSMAYTSIDFVINRSRNMDIALLFELQGIRVFNSSQITLLGNNKLAAYAHAKQCNITFSPIHLNHMPDMISKPNNGHGGSGVGFASQIPKNDTLFRIHQTFVAQVVGDVRFYIINNQIVHAVLRMPSSPGEFRSNFSLGGQIELYQWGTKESRIITTLLEHVTADYCGIDFLLTEDNMLYFNELEDVVGSRMLSALNINNTVELYLNHISDST